MTLIMGVLNVTPDSFSDGGRYFTGDRAVAHGRQLIADGADIVDIGGESTRPGAMRISATEEQDRILPVIAQLAPLGAALSVDTMNASTARVAVGAGARIVNDVSGGLADADMLAAVAGTDATIVLQHWRGHSDDMYARAEYDDIVDEVIAELGARVQAAVDAGIPLDRIVVDPGFGFGKQPADNWLLARGLPRIVAHGHTVMIGTSRKRMISEVLPDAASEARKDLATAVTSVLAAQAGVWAVRVHDVVSTRIALAVRERWEGQ